MNSTQLSLSLFLLLLGITIFPVNSSPPPIEYENIKVPLVTLTDSNFEKYVVSDNYGPWFVMFFAPWCSHCEKAYPSMMELAKVAFGKINVGVVNCDENPMLVKKYGITGFPRFRYFKSGEIYPYAGNRNVKAYVRFMTKDYKMKGTDQLASDSDTSDEFNFEIETMHPILAHIKSVAQERPVLLGVLVTAFIVVAISTFFSKHQNNSDTNEDSHIESDLLNSKHSDTVNKKKSDNKVEDSSETNRPKVD